MLTKIRQTETYRSASDFLKKCCSLNDVPTVNEEQICHMNDLS